MWHNLHHLTAMLSVSKGSQLCKHAHFTDRAKAGSGPGAGRVLESFFAQHGRLHPHTSAFTELVANGKYLQNKQADSATQKLLMYVQVSLDGAFHKKLQTSMQLLLRNIKPAYSGGALYTDCKQLVSAIQRSDIFVLATAVDGSARDMWTQMWESSDVADALAALFSQCANGRRSRWGQSSPPSYENGTAELLAGVTWSVHGAFLPHGAGCPYLFVKFGRPRCR